DGPNARGYEAADFRDSFERYLPSPASISTGSERHNARPQVSGVMPPAPAVRDAAPDQPPSVLAFPGPVDGDSDKDRGNESSDSMAYTARVIRTERRRGRSDGDILVL